MSPLRTLAFVVNREKQGAPELAHLLRELAVTEGVQVRTTEEFPIAESYLEGCDACCVIGGDGTLLGVVRSAARYGVPVIGVNRGSLGFLTTFSAEEARNHFGSLLKGEFDVAERSLLDCSTGPG